MLDSLQLSPPSAPSVRLGPLPLPRSADEAQSPSPARGSAIYVTAIPDAAARRSAISAHSRSSAAI
jgi:hypothetical protein